MFALSIMIRKNLIIYYLPVSESTQVYSCLGEFLGLSPPLNIGTISPLFHSDGI